MRKVLKESFIPILLVLLALFVILAIVRFQAGLDAEQVTVIRIEGGVVADMEDEDGIALMTTAVRSDDPRLAMAEQLVAEGRWQEAEKSYQSLIIDAPSSQAWAELGSLYYSIDRYEEALQALNKAVQLEPVYLAAYFFRALTLARKEQYGLAVTDYKKLLAGNPYHYEGHFNLGLIYLKTEQYKEAVTILQKAATLTGGARKAQVYYQLARAYEKQGEQGLHEARKWLQQSIRLNPAYINPRLLMARLEGDSAQGRERAEQWYLQVLELQPNHARTLYRLAELYEQTGEKNKALQRLRETVQYDPQYKDARYKLGLLLLDEGYAAEAKDQFSAIIAAHSDNDGAYFNRGRSFYRLKNYPAAAQDYNRAIELRAGHYPEARMNLALVHYADKDYPKAIKALQSAIDERPDYESAWYRLGRAYRQIGDHEQAVFALQKAAQLQAEHAHTWYYLGRSYADLDRGDEAVQAYQKAVALEPGYRSAQLNLAVWLSRLQSNEQAEQVYLQLVERYPNYSIARTNLGVFYSELDRYEDAEEHLRKAVELEPQESKPLRLLSEALSRQQKYDEAITSYRQAVDMEPADVYIRWLYARTLRRAGELQQAKDELNKAMALQPDDPRLARELQRVNAQLRAP